MRLHLFSLALCACAATARAADRRSIDITDLSHLRVASVSALTAAPGGVLATYQPASETPEIDFFAAGARTVLAQSPLAALSPNGRYLCVLHGQRWVLRDQKTGRSAAFDMGEAPRGLPTTPVWSPDSRFVAIHYDQAVITDPAATPITVERGARVQVLTGDPAAIHQRASSHLNPHILIWDVRSAQPRVIRSSATETFSGDWRHDPDGRHTYYFAAGQHPYGGQAAYTAVRALQAETGQVRELYRTAAYNQTLRPKLSPDGRTLAFCADTDAKAYGVANNLVALDLVTSTSTVLTRDQSLNTAVWGANGDLYVLRRDGAFTQLERVDLRGRAQRLTHDQVARSSMIASNDRKVLSYTTMDAYGRSEIRQWVLAAAHETRMATISDPGSAYRLGSARAVQWKADDGLTLRGLVIRPPDYDPKRLYPMLVDVHGGGPGSHIFLFTLLGYGAMTPLEWHLWAERGYVVFVPDYRSSGEYGAAVNTARTRQGERDGDLGGIVRDAEDVEEGVRALIAGGGVDTRRIALFGQSAGGARVNYLLTRTRLFSAGIIHDQIDSGAMAEDLEEAREGVPITWYGREPLSPEARRKQLSGFLFDGWRSRTPTLIMVGNPDHGGLDPLSAETLFAMLQSVHVPTRFVRFLDDGHFAASAAGVEARYVEIKAWLDRYAPAS